MKETGDGFLVNQGITQNCLSLYYGYSYEGGDRPCTEPYYSICQLNIWSIIITIIIANFSSFSLKLVKNKKKKIVISNPSSIHKVLKTRLPKEKNAC